MGWVAGTTKLTVTVTVCGLRLQHDVHACILVPICATTLPLPPLLHALNGHLAEATVLPSGLHGKELAYMQ